MPLLSRIANVFRSGKLNRDLDDELRFHIEERMAELIRDGASPEEAARQARRMLGSPLRTREASRDIKLLPRLESLVQDAQFGLRMLRRNPVVTVAAVFSLSLAIGACTAAFSLIDALILRPLPVHEPERLVYLTAETNGRISESSTYPLFERLRDAGREYADLFAMNYTFVRRRAVFDYSSGQEEKIRCQFVSGDAFPNLGIGPALGRVLTPEDDLRPGDHPVAVISHAFWERRFGRDPDVLGRWLSIMISPGSMETKQFQIVGVAQQGFWGVEPGFLTDVWVPTMMWHAASLTNPDATWFRTWGRLKQGVEPEQLARALEPAFANFRREAVSRFHPDTPSERVESFLSTRLVVQSAANGPSSIRQSFERPLWILGGVAGLVLLIACSNVANLFIARAAAREREMALRVSIGAGRSRLVQQVLVESVLLAAGACILGLGLAAAAAPSMVSLLSPAANPAYLDLRIDWRILGFVALLCALTTVLFGLAPALRASTVSPSNALKTGGQKQSAGMGVFRPLVSAQVGFSFVVLFLSGLLLLTFQKLSSVDLGFTKSGVLLFSIEAKDPQPGQSMRAATRQLQDHIRELSGVEAASLSSWSLFGGQRWSQSIRLPGQETESFSPFYLGVSPGFFETMGIRLLDGREFEPRDTQPERPTAVIVNETFARQFFSGENALGRSFSRLGRPDELTQEIVGVVADAKYDRVREPAPPTVYVPYGGGNQGTLEVRTALDPLAMVSTLREEIQRAHPAFQVTDVTLQSTLVEDDMLRERLLAMLSGFFALIAVVLAAVGLYGVLTYSVVRRTKEIGIRVALGARQVAVVRLVISEITLLVGAGLAGGAAAGFWLAQFLGALLFEVQPSDFWSLTLPLVCLLAAAALAAAPPAVRAARVDPMVALRYE